MQDDLNGEELKESEIRHLHNKPSVGISSVADSELPPEVMIEREKTL